MKKYIFLISLLGFPTCLLSQTSCQVENQKPIQLLSAEIKRSMKAFKKQKPPIYYIAYNYYEYERGLIEVQEQGVGYNGKIQNRALQVQARAGNPHMDNTRTLKTDRTYYALNNADLPVIDEDGKAFTMAVWRITQSAAEEAQQDYNRVRADAQTAATRTDESPDFVFPPKETFCKEEPALQFNVERIEQMLLKTSALTKNQAFILDSDFTFSYITGSRYFVDSVGSRLKVPVRLARLSYQLTSKTADGALLKRTNTYDVLQEEQLPSQEKLLADVKQSLEELKALYQAPEAAPITTPAILKNRAMAVFVHEVLGHRVEGHRQKEDSFGKTFTDKIGKQVVSPLLSIVDDATLAEFNQIPLRGFYYYDEEGVKARPVTLVENGILKGFLMSSSPINGFPSSNGHGRSEEGKRPVARMGNTRVIASQTIPYEQLEQQLLQEIKRQGKPYGFIIEDLSGGFTMTDTDFPQTFKLTPTLVYRIYPDGHKEIVRGADMVGTPLVSFNEIIAAADDYEVFNGSCGAESGWVPVSGIAPSVLLRKLEIERTGKTDTKPPVLPPPNEEEK